jgi:glycerate 2-kinase
VKPLAELRVDAQTIFNAGLKGVDCARLIKRSVNVIGSHLEIADRSYGLSEIRRIFVAGCGKAAAPMARALEQILGDRITAGVVIVKYGHALPLDKVKLIEAGHPVPDQAGMDGARQIFDLASYAGAGDLFLLVISGGGSALLPLPAEGLTLSDKQRTTEALLCSGANIHEVNSVRKHISQLKGGRLAQLAQPAKLVALMVSDVIGDDLDVIASGPTVPDRSRYEDCLAIIRRYDLVQKIPRVVLDLLERGARGEVAETPKPSAGFFRNVQNVIVGNNALALSASRAQAALLGYDPTVISSTLSGESRIVAQSHGARLKKTAEQRKLGDPPLCLISGGETTVTVHGDGVGGRNQEFGLATALEIQDASGIVVLSGGTDGSDGPTEAAGAIVDALTIKRGQALGLDAQEFLRRNDSHHFLQATGDLLVTGPTLTNVMDIQVSLIA